MEAAKARRPQSIIATTPKALGEFVSATCELLNGLGKQPQTNHLHVAMKSPQTPNCVHQSVPDVYIRVYIYIYVTCVYLYIYIYIYVIYIYIYVICIYIHMYKT